MNSRSKFSTAPRDLGSNAPRRDLRTVTTREAARDLREAARIARTKSVLAPFVADSQGRIDRLRHSWDVIRVPKDERGAFYPEGESVGLVYKRATDGSRRLITRASVTDDLRRATRVLREPKAPRDATRAKSAGERQAARRAAITRAASARPCIVCKRPESDPVHATEHRFVWHR